MARARTGGEAELGMGPRGLEPRGASEEVVDDTRQQAAILLAIAAEDRVGPPDFFRGLIFFDHVYSAE